MALAATAIVTGHTRGLGEAIAAQLLSRDVHVLGIARHDNAELAKQHGDALTQVRLDLTEAAALTSWLKSNAIPSHVRESPIALLVNNAGMLQPIGPPETQDIELVLRTVAVNVGAALALSAAFVAATSGARDRRILHISSGAGRKAHAGWSVYGATKAALDLHARAVALDATPALRVSSVAPGVIDTEMQAEIRRTPEDKFPERQRYIDLWREGRLPSTEQVGRAVVDFLLSEDFGREVISDLRRVSA